eukprot:TRINITY_DN19292_c0_g1_i2.p1 TRINITY_DN19292_c0_g1~~TRINITY_DN19292_c0_g1_i2.p1  ORF type:complete len:442 (+),score=148.48 TRINITY_DN19292_c0_g1_i2:601-1926(+)
MREGNGWVHRPPVPERDVEGDTIRSFLKVRKREMQSQMDSLTQALHVEMQERMLAEQLCQEVRARAREEEVKLHLELEALRKQIAEMATEHEAVLIKLSEDQMVFTHSSRNLSEHQLATTVENESTQRESVIATEETEFSNLKRISQLEEENASLRHELKRKEIDEVALQEFLRSKKADMNQRLEEEALSKRVLASKLASRDSELDDARQNADELMKELNGYQRLQQQAIRLQSKLQIAEETLAEVRRQHLSTKAELNRFQRSHEEALEKHQSELEAQQLSNEEEQASLKDGWEKTSKYADGLEDMLKVSRSETTQLKEQVRATAYSMQEGLSANLRAVTAAANTPQPRHLQAPAASRVSVGMSSSSSNNNNNTNTNTNTNANTTSHTVVNNNGSSGSNNIMDGVYIPVPRESHPAPPPPTPLFNTVNSQNKLEFDTPELV